VTDIRVGTGFDAHAFAESRPLILGGVVIPHSHGLAGDSDADVLFHAVADALLGAAGLGDLGRFYPPGDPRSKGLDSGVILTECAARITAERWSIANIDATLIAQKPKLAPYLDAMRHHVARHTGLPIDRVSVKAKSTDQLGFVGRAEGIASIATVLLTR
jgi:2-C-methyl-D-erythritol 2,4-cyclodiphosphate synthase